MSREVFNRRLHQLVDEVLVLGSMVEQAVHQSVVSLIRHDLSTANLIITGDQKINEKRFDIENQCITLIATQQPMGRDVRFLAAILEIITELERIGDYGKGISRINLMLEEDPGDKPIFLDLQTMADQGLDMLHRALGAFVTNDAAVALAIPSEDDIVDQLYLHIYHELVQQMIADPRTIDHGNHLIWAAHNLERMADRVTNICERITYVATGVIKELDVT